MISLFLLVDLYDKSEFGPGVYHGCEQLTYNVTLRASPMVVPPKGTIAHHELNRTGPFGPVWSQ